MIGFMNKQGLKMTAVGTENFMCSFIEILILRSYVIIRSSGDQAP